jgi:hypothetical protein
MCSKSLRLGIQNLERSAKCSSTQGIRALRARKNSFCSRAQPHNCPVAAHRNGRPGETHGAASPATRRAGLPNKLHPINVLAESMVVPNLRPIRNLRWPANQSLEQNIQSLRSKYKNSYGHCCTDGCLQQANRKTPTCQVSLTSSQPPTKSASHQPPKKPANRKTRTRNRKGSFCVRVKPSPAHPQPIPQPSPSMVEFRPRLGLPAHARLSECAFGD